LHHIFSSKNTMLDGNSSRMSLSRTSKLSKVAGRMQRTAGLTAAMRNVSKGAIYQASRSFLSAFRPHHARLHRS
jgi:hypothetical protein